MTDEARPEIRAHGPHAPLCSGLTCLKQRVLTRGYLIGTRLGRAGCRHHVRVTEGKLFVQTTHTPVGGDMPQHTSQGQLAVSRPSALRGSASPSLRTFSLCTLCVSVSMCLGVAQAQEKKKNRAPRKKKKGFHTVIAPLPRQLRHQRTISTPMRLLRCLLAALVAPRCANSFALQHRARSVDSISVSRCRSSTASSSTTGLSMMTLQAKGLHRALGAVLVGGVLLAGNVDGAGIARADVSISPRCECTPVVLLLDTSL